MSGRAESLSSPSGLLGVRDLHSNGRALSTGEPDEEQSRPAVSPLTASAFCYRSPPGSLSHLSDRGGGVETDKCSVAVCSSVHMLKLDAVCVKGTAFPL